MSVPDKGGHKHLPAESKSLGRLAEKLATRFFDETWGLPVTVVGARLLIIAHETLEEALEGRVYRVVSLDAAPGALDEQHRDGRGFVWFDTSPMQGEPDCVCSSCGEVIQDGPGETAFRMWTGGEEALEARFHQTCFRTLYNVGVLRPARDE